MTKPAQGQSRHGPLPGLLLGLTFMTGLIDAVSFFRFDHVFVANMTGNVVFLGFALTDPHYFSIPASSLALIGFIAGALGGGRLGTVCGQHRARYLAVALAVNAVIFGGVAITAALVEPAQHDWLRYAMVAVLALAMGLQNATARRLAVPDLTTTVLTLTLTGLDADSAWAGGTNPRPLQRFAAVITMFAGAALGAALVVLLSAATVIGLAFLLLVIVGGLALRHWRSSEAWTAPA